MASPFYHFEFHRDESSFCFWRLEELNPCLVAINPEGRVGRFAFRGMRGKKMVHRRYTAIPWISAIFRGGRRGKASRRISRYLVNWR